MAYSFDRTMAALGQTQDDEDDSSQNQSNVLAPSQGKQNYSATIPTDTITATNAAGDLSGAGNAGAATAKSPDSPNVSNTTANNSLINKNAGRVSSPIDVQGLQNNIGAAKTNLQNEANSYVQGGADLFGGSQGLLGDRYGQQINSFVNTGIDPGAASSEPLPNGSDQAPTSNNFDSYMASQKNPSAATQPYAFTDLYRMGQTQVNPFVSNTNTNFSDATDLGTDAGLRNLFRRNNDAEYTAGQAALDTSLLTHTPGFNQARDQVTQANQDLQNYKNSATANAQTAAQAQRDAAQKLWKANANDALSSAEAAVQSGAQSQADALTKQLGLFDKNVYGTSQAIDPTTGRAAPNSVVNAADYVKNTFDPATVNWKDFLNSNQAAGYNATNALMGNGQATIGGAGRFSGQNADGSVTPYNINNAFTFDQTGYGNAAKDAALQRQKQAQVAAAAQAAAQTKAEQNSPFKVGGYTDNGEGTLGPDPKTADYNSPIIYNPFDTQRLRNDAFNLEKNALRNTRFY